MAADIQDEQYIKCLRQECASFLNRALEELGISRMGQKSFTIINKLRKDDMAKLLSDALNCLDDLTACTTDFTNAPSSMKTELIESQRSVIKLQSELLECKDDQLNSLKVTVKTSVEESVKAEIQSYSSVVENNRVQKTSFSPDALKKVVQNAVQDEDRSRNVMIFGLSEVPDEELDSTVGDVFQAIGEKPRIEACRVGKVKLDKSVRPIKVTFASSTVVENILSKAKKLKSVEKFRSVFVSPDRSLEQRIKHRELIKELKRKVNDEPNQRHFIKGGEICSVPKSGGG